MNATLPTATAETGRRAGGAARGALPKSMTSPTKTMKLSRIPLVLLLCAALPLAASAQEAAAKQEPAKPDAAARQALNDQLYEAARKGDAAEVRALLDRGAEVDARFRYGATALFKAAERGHTEVVKLLLERGADATVKDTFYSATALTWALDKKHVEVVRLLLDKDAGGVDAVLMAGAREGNADLLRVALDKGGTKPETLTSALVAATESGKADLAEMLRKAGAKPPFEVDAATLATYVGLYKSEQRGDISFTVKDGKFYLVPAGQPPLALMALDKTTFKPVAFDGLTAAFVVEGDKVTGFNLKRGPETTLFKKQ